MFAGSIMQSLFFSLVVERGGGERTKEKEQATKKQTKRANYKSGESCTWTHRVA